jgi:hypothetical protein
VWPTLAGLGRDQQKEVGWLINQQALQPLIDNGMPFEYTLNGIKPDDLLKENDAIKAIWSGATDAEIIDALKLGSLPSLMKELKELYEVGYQLSFDAATNSYILIKP